MKYVLIFYSLLKKKKNQVILKLVPHLQGNTLHMCEILQRKELKVLDHRVVFNEGYMRGTGLVIGEK